MYNKMNAAKARKLSKHFGKKVDFADKVYSMIDTKTKEGKFNITLNIESESKETIDIVVQDLKDNGYTASLEFKEDDIIFGYYRLEISW